MPLLNILNLTEKISSQGESLLGIFDLDSTLFKVQPRTQKILIDFSNHPDFLMKYPKQCDVIKKIKVKQSDWGIKEPLSRIKVEGNLDFFHDIHAFWKLHFFSNSYLKYDEPYEGAVNFVKSLAQKGAKIIYLTGRDVERMGAGSLDSLNQHKFPIGNQHELILKPKKEMSDSKFKNEIINKLKKDHKEVYFFENEPVNTKLIEEHHKDVNIIFFDSVHSGREPSPHQHISIQNFLY